MISKKVLLYIMFFFSFCNVGTDEKTYSRNNTLTQISLSNRIIDLLLGNEIDADSISAKPLNPVESLFLFLNRSQHKQIIELITNQYSTDTIFSGGFWGFKERKYEPNLFIKYSYFRVNDFSENIEGNLLLSQFVSDYFDSSSLNLINFQHAEYLYTQNKVNFKPEKSIELIRKLRALKLIYPKALRVDFLLGTQYLAINDSVSAKKIFNNLIEKNYYALPSIRVMMNYYYKNRSETLDEYIKLLNDKFPEECNLYKIDKKYLSSQDQSVIRECNKCYNSFFQIDSIYAKLFLAKFFFEKKQFADLQILLEQYLAGMHTEPYNEQRQIIKGQYFDYKLRMLFQQKKYNEFRLFVKDKLLNNPIVVINNDDEYRKYLFKLYTEYISNDSSSFSKFSRFFFK